MSDDKKDDGVEIVIPMLGDSVTEVTLGDWCVRPGDFVTNEHPVGVLSLDKADMDLEAPASGIFEPKQDQLAGTVVKPGDVVGRIVPPPPIDPAKIARHEELLAAIADADDDASRRAYADFLLDGAFVLPPWGIKTVAQRGEYLDLVQRLKRPSPNDDVVAMERRRTALEPLARSTAYSLLRHASRENIEDGFAVSLTVRLADFVATLRTILARVPLRALSLKSLDDATDELQTVPPLQHLRTLSLVGNHKKPAPTDGIVRVLGLPMFRSVDRVVLESCTFVTIDDFLATIAALPHCRELRLRGVVVGDTPAQSFATEIAALTDARLTSPE